MAGSDVKREVDLILGAVHGAPKQKPATVNFNQEAFLKALNESLVERFPRLTSPGQSALFVYRGDLPLQRIAYGMAAASKREAVVIQLQSEDLDLRRGDGKRLLYPLLHGKTVILVDDQSSSIGANLAAYWPEFAKNPTGYSASVTKNVILCSQLSIEQAGSVVVLQGQSRMPSSYFTTWPLVEEDAVALTALADSWTGEIEVIGRPPTERIAFRNNEEAYRAYRALVRDIEAAGYDRAVAERIMKRAIGGVDSQKLEIEFLANKIDLKLYESLYYRLSAVSEHCGKIHGGFREDEVLPDVYAAALIISRLWSADPRHVMVYRGQRNSRWPLVPCYFRCNRDGSPPDLQAREQRLRRFIGLLARDYPQLSEWQCVAVAQHVSSEAKTPTWLIDVTWDPLIALYFASSGAESLDVGIVDNIVVPEWKSLVAGTAELPGGFMTLEVPVIERVQRQRGLFLNAPRADLYDRYSPHRLWFRQQAGVVFTDSTADPPIDDTSMLPAETHLEELIAALEDSNVRVQPVSIVAPPADPLSPLTANALLETVKHREEVVALDPFHRFILEVIAELFANPQEWAEDQGASKYSVHRFDEAIRFLTGAQEGVPSRVGRCYLNEALTFTKTRLTENEWNALIWRAHNIWMERYRIPPAHVVAQLAGFVEELHGLAPAVLGAAFAGSPDHCEFVLQALSADDRWRFYDLRSASAEDALEVLPELAGGGVAVVAAHPDLKPQPLYLLTKAVADKTSLRLGGEPLHIAQDCVIVFVFGRGKPYNTLGASDVIMYAKNIDDFDRQ